MSLDSLTATPADVLDQLPAPVLAPGTSLSKRTLDAFAWQLLSGFSRFALQIGVQIALARLLPVEAFGLLTLAMFAINLGSTVSNIGAGPALIQRHTITDTHIRVAFSLSVLSGAIVTVAIWLSAPAVASLFNVGEVTSIVRLLGLVFMFGSLGATAEALLQRRMDYRRLLWVELISYVFGYAVIGIVLALLGFGAWSLAWATVFQALLRSLVLILLSPHPARPCFAKREVQQLLNFGIGMTLSHFASFAAQNGDYFVVGRWLGTVALGLYSRAYQLMCLPIYQFSASLNAVLFPAYSSIQHDSTRLRRAYLASLSLSSIVVFPVLAMFAVGAPEMMTGLFGPQWIGASTPLQILCVGGGCYSIYNLADSLVRAKGAVYEKFFYHSIFAACVIAGARVGSRWGLEGVTVGVVAAIVVVYLLMAHLSLRLTDCSWSRFFRSQVPGVAIAAVVVGFGVPTALMLRTAELPPLITLAGIWTASVLAALAASLIFPSRWLDAAVLNAMAMAKKHGRDTLAWVWRYCQPSFG